jgi:hypothetical protein
MDPTYYRYKGHRFSIISQPVRNGNGCRFSADIYWVEHNREEFTRFNCERTFLTPQEARMEGIAVVRDWIDAGKPSVNNVLRQAILKSEHLLDQLRSAFERSFNTIERSRMLRAEMGRVLEESRLALLASKRQPDRQGRW